MAAPNVQVLNRQLAGIRAPGQDKDFLIDCLLSDNHTFDSDVTEFPVESGATISDNIRNKPLVVAMECLISNTPIGELATLRDTISDPSDTAYELMIKIRTDRLPVTIRTSLRTYENMALQSLSIPRASGRGDELKFTATFKQIELVTNKRDKRVAIPGARTGGAKTFSPFLDNTSGYLYVDPATSSWYDPAVNGWRKSVHFKEAQTAPNPLASGVLVLNGEPAPVELFDDAPEAIGYKVWANERVDQHTIALTKTRLLAISHGVVNGPFAGPQAHPARNLLFLPPGQYRLVRLHP